MFGRNDKAQCGLGSVSATSPPTRPLLPAGHAVRVVACGGSHTVRALDPQSPFWGTHNSDALIITHRETQIPTFPTPELCFV